MSRSPEDLGRAVLSRIAYGLACDRLSEEAGIAAPMGAAILVRELVDQIAPGSVIGSASRAAIEAGVRAALEGKGPPRILWHEEAVIANISGSARRGAPGEEGRAMADEDPACCIFIDPGGAAWSEIAAELAAAGGVASSSDLAFRFPSSEARDKALRLVQTRYGSGSVAATPSAWRRGRHGLSP